MHYFQVKLTDSGAKLEKKQKQKTFSAVSKKQKYLKFIHKEAIIHLPSPTLHQPGSFPTNIFYLLL